MRSSPTAAAASKPPGSTGGLYRETTQRALDDVHGEGTRRGLRPLRLDRPAGDRDALGRRPGLRLLVAAGALLTSLLTCAATGFSNLSHDVGGYLGERLAERCEPELLVRWAQLGALTPLMQAHGRFQQEAWTYDGQVLDDYREAVLLHERLVPYIRAAAATAARSGLPIMRPLCLVDPEDPEGWAIPDSYMFGPSLWVAPVLEEGATERRTYLPRGDWFDWWTGERLAAAAGSTPRPRSTGSRSGCAPGSLLVTYPAERRRPRARRRGRDAAARGDPLGRAGPGPRRSRSGGRHPRRLAARRLVGLAGPRINFRERQAHSHG